MLDKLFDFIDNHIDLVTGILITLMGLAALGFVIFGEHNRESEIVLCLFGIGALVFGWQTRKM